MESGDSSGLTKFVDRTHKDAAGKVHSFETDPAVIRTIIEHSESDFGAFADLHSEPEEADMVA